MSKINKVAKAVGISQQDLDLMQSFEDHITLREHAQDYIDTYTNEEIAQLVREGVLTMEEVEAGLRRRHGL